MEGLDSHRPSAWSNSHLFAERLDAWATDNDVGALFADNEAAHQRRVSFVKQFTQATCLLGMQAKELKRRSGKAICVVPCVDCNTPYDSSANHNHEGNTVVKRAIGELRLADTACEDMCHAAHTGMLYLACSW